MELGKEIGAALGGHNSASSPIGRIRSAFDEVRRFEIIKEIGHDRTVDAEELSQGELAPNCPLGRCRKDLVAPGTTREIGDRLVCGCDVGPKHRAKTPAEVVRQGVVTATGFADIVAVTREVVHLFNHTAPDPKRCPIDAR
jgi:hypothetical protein